MNKITTDICIVGAGPVGLFAVFECGLLKMRCHVIDAIGQVGGQLTEIYPKKPIYDIPGFPEILAGDLIKNLMQQIEPFKPTFTLGERVENLNKQEDGSYIVETAGGTQVHCKAVCIAGGLGSFEPRKPALEKLGLYEGNGVNYMVMDPEFYRGKKVVIAGGGDSALDWSIFLTGVASELTLVRRGSCFRGAPESAEKVGTLADEGQMRLLLKSNVVAIDATEKLENVTVQSDDQSTVVIEADYFIPLYGLVPKLGPIENWGLQLEKSAIVVNT